MNRRPCYPSDRVCVVLCTFPIVSVSCESGSESSSRPPHKLWQDVPPTKRTDVPALVWVSAFRDVLLFVWVWVCMCVAFVVVSSHIHVSLPLWPSATFCISLWLLLFLLLFLCLLQREASWHPQRMCTHIWPYVLYVCACMCIRVSVSPIIVAKGTLMYWLCCLGVTLSAGSCMNNAGWLSCC